MRNYRITGHILSKPINFFCKTYTTERRPKMNRIQMSAYTIKESDKRRNLMVLLYSLGIVSVPLTSMILGFVGFYVGIIMLILLFYFGNEEFHRWRSMQTGIKGEDYFHDSLSKAVGNSKCALYQGIATDYGDLDYLLVGLGGVYAFEIKNHSGYINYNENGWKKVKVSGSGIAYNGGIGNPSGQLGRNIMWLKNYLNSEGIDNIWIKGIVVFTHPKARLSVKGLKNVMAITPEGIPEAVRGAEIGEEKAVRIIEAVDRLKEQ